MARVGSFSGPNFAFGVPLSLAHPSDNKFPRFDPAIEAEAGLTDSERQDLQDQADELAATLILSRDYVE